MIFRGFLQIYSMALLVLSELYRRLPIGMARQKLRPDLRNFSGVNLVHSAEPVDVLFACSSAGEYEQALPIIHHLEASGRRVAICFFSYSGYRFAEVRKESRTYFLAPFDSLIYWRRVRKILSPQQVILVRYELWPCFLSVFGDSSKLWLFVLSFSSFPKG